MGQFISILLAGTGIIVSLAGLIGCILPIIPGPPLSYAALLILCLALGWDTFSIGFLILFAVLTAVVTILDFVLPAIFTKKAGASSRAVWGSVVGMFAGIFLFPPWGMIIGSLAGAVAGELSKGKELKAALKAGWGVFMGNAAATLLKLTVSGIMLFYYFAGMIRNWN